MSNEDKRLIFDYMEWKLDKGLPYPDGDGGFKYMTGTLTFNGNDIVSAMTRMVELGDWEDFFRWFSHSKQARQAELKHSNFVPWLMQPDNFFKLLGAWLKEKGK